MTKQLCPDCGKPLPAEAPAGMCPSCLLRLGVRTAEPSPLEATGVPPSANPITAASEGQSPLTAEKEGTLIGRYRLLEAIGEGGFGTVWLAEQTAPVRRKVALKIIKLGMDTKEVVARFEAERQALALMDHPNIARVFDGGATDSGRPYFVMELVKGVRITDYCDAQRLSTEERIKLFMAVCQAVQHAHQKGIIHRDLKPSNVLVTEQDGLAVPKVIDFGIAKATEQVLTENSFFTRFNQILGTPAYMSPEQAGLGRLDIDTRSDIYSLGVLLYELLTGRTPFSNEALLKAGLDQVLRIIREKDPPKPSTQLSTLTQAESQSVAKRHGTAPAKLSRLMRRELDWIVMKCLEKDRARRYETAYSLARDLERYLSNEVIVARPPGTFYRIQKAIRRHRLAFTAAVTVAMVLVAGIIASNWQAARAMRAEREQARLRQMAVAEKQKAETQAARSDEVSQFLTEMLRAAGPSVAKGRDASLLRDILEGAARRVSTKLAEQPEARGDIQSAIGRTYVDIGDSAQAIPHFEQAASSYRVALGTNHCKIARALAYLGSAQSFIGKTSEGTANAASGLEIARRLNDDFCMADCLQLFVSSLSHWGRVDHTSASYLREAVALYRKPGMSKEGLVSSLKNLAIAVEDPAEGVTLAHEALLLATQQFGEQSPTTASVRFVLGQRLVNNAQLAEGEAELRKTIELWRKVFDPAHPSRSIVFRYFIWSLAVLGRWEVAVAEIETERTIFASNSYCSTLAVAVDIAHGRWHLVSSNFLAARENQTDKNETEFNEIIALAATGDHQRYRERAHEYLAWAATRKDFVSAERASKAALLIPPTGADLETAGDLADFAVTATNAPNFIAWASMTKALADYRRGRFGSAGEWAGRVLQTEAAQPGCRAAAFFIKDLALARSQQADPGRTAWRAGSENLKRFRSDIILQHWVLDDFGSARDWIIADILHHERP